MHDIRLIRTDPDWFDKAMARRGLPPQSPAILQRDAQRRSLQTELQSKQTHRNAQSRLIGEGKRKGLDTSDAEKGVVQLRDEIESMERDVGLLDKQIFDILAGLPNVLDAGVPDGPDETANVVLKTWGEPHDSGFQPKQHDELGETLGMMDFATAAKLSGSRFTLLRGPLARLERALGQFMIDLHTREHGYEETIVPLLVNDAAVFGTNNLPKFAEDLFHTTDGRWLIPTAECPLTNTVAGEIVAEKRLPIRLTALSDCFRSEAGAAGKDTRGMIRQHQFRKVELVSIAHPEHSDEEHERMTTCAERVLELLQLPYRRVVLSSGDTGFGAAKTYDLEVWLPGQQTFREISSCSNTRDFQARRMNGRFRGADGKIGFVHTLNGSGIAVGRALIAVMENYQTADGSIVIPQALGPYLRGLDRIAA